MNAGLLCFVLIFKQIFLGCETNDLSLFFLMGTFAFIYFVLHSKHFFFSIISI